MNGFARTAVLLAGLTAVFIGLGLVIGGQQGMVMALLFAIVTNAFAYWNSDKVVLRMYRAQPVDERTAPVLHRMVSRLAEQAGLPLPTLYVIRDDRPNAFATGRNPENAAVAVTTGLLDALGPQEVEGVVAHELAHVKNRDTLVMTVAATLAGALTTLANFGVMFGGANRDGRGSPFGAIGAILALLAAPFVSMIVQTAISRSREYEADRLGAEICGQPPWLASALERIQSAVRRDHDPLVERHPSTAHMFIVNPLHGGAFRSLMSTHPPTEERGAILREMAQSWGGPTPSARPAPAIGGFTRPKASPGGGPWGRR